MDVDHRKLLENLSRDDASECHDDAEFSPNVCCVSDPVTDRKAEFERNRFHRCGNQRSPASATTIALCEHQGDLMSRVTKTRKRVRGNLWGAKKDKSDLVCSASSLRRA